VADEASGRGRRRAGARDDVARRVLVVSTNAGGAADGGVARCRGVTRTSARQSVLSASTSTSAFFHLTRALLRRDGALRAGASDVSSRRLPDTTRDRRCSPRAYAAPQGRAWIHFGAVLAQDVGPRGVASRRVARLQPMSANDGD
jgi:hypothetical protein